ncbi:hypothetical protein P43SY_005354 [Pythium insidiosum]|uniref:Uncharacterized protein n=1 Tax=Pythium insidiosum TaxID=114742 RepID=A0AAD5MGM7_PYTIN|nr:hypothetical protein P43SY_005354 [Pythium insidiosum]
MGMSRPWRRCVLVMAVWMALVAPSTPQPLLSCERTALRAVSPSDWRIFCEEAPAGSHALTFDPHNDWRIFCEEAPAGSHALTFDPHKLEALTLQLTADAAVQPKGRLSATFQHVGPLVSSTLRALTLQAEPEWVHKLPVSIDKYAFTRLTALQSL